MDQRYPAVQRGVDDYVCGYPGCGNDQWTGTNTDVFCYNGHPVPADQVDALYGDDELVD